MGMRRNRSGLLVTQAEATRGGMILTGRRAWPVGHADDDAQTFHRPGAAFVTASGIGECHKPA